tara:strand:+ start:4143 stop:5453 length:1311 start_codon:yes stop_codon:yes gene_type:complete
MGQIAAFLVKLVFTLMLWALAAVGAVTLLAAGYVALLLPYTNDDPRRAHDLGVQWLNDSHIVRQPDPTRCAEYVRNLNIMADANLPEAYAVIENFDYRQVCGDWPNLEPGHAFGLSLERGTLYPEFLEQLYWANNRFGREVLGRAGNRQFWRSYYVLADACTNDVPWSVDGDLLDRGKSEPEFSARNSREYVARRNFECGNTLVELAATAFELDHSRIRTSGHWMMQAATRYNDPDAIWWIEFVYPTIDPDYFGEFGPLLEEAVEPILGCQDDSQRRQMLRELTGLGQQDASHLYLAIGIPEADSGPAACNDSNWPALPTPWRGGYDTPFWYAVHAIRTGNEDAARHLPAIETDMGRECMAMARILAGEIGAVLPGPPQDSPAARQMIAESIACQPDDMREASAYPDGVYEPVETLLFPSFEPRFVPVPIESSRTQ